MKKEIMYLQELGINPYKNTFENRKIIQETLYLLKCLDLQIKYNFELTVRGVYSKKLTEDLNTLLKLKQISEGRE